MATRQGAETGAFALVRRRMSLRGRFGRGPRVAAAVLLAVAVVAGGTGAWAIRYDRHTINILPSDTVIGGVPVGGLRFHTAVDRLKARLEAPLHEPIHVSAEGFQADTTAWDMGLQINVRSAVEKAMAANHQGNLFDRVWRRWRGNDHRVMSLKPAWKGGLSTPLLDEAKKAVAVAPRNARLDTSSGFVRVTPDVEGRALDTDRAKDVLTASLQRGDKRVQLPVVHPRAAVQSSAFATVILVRTGENRLYLYKNGQLSRSYQVATGRPQFPTPTGTFRVVGKLTNPVWINPHDSWSASMPERIGPGPDNPLGTHALALSASGVLIHETPDVGSIGTNASHGCIRMRGGDEVDLFNQVPTGTSVVILSAGAPKPRSDTPTPQSANQNAAVNY